MRTPPRLRKMTLVWLGVAFVLAAFIVARKVEADGQAPISRVAAQSLVPAEGGVPLPSAPVGEAGPAPSLAPPGPPTHVKNAAVEGHSSFEVADVEAGGGVPVQRKGRYRSPFADPRAGTPVDIRFGVLVNELRDYDIKEGTFNADFFLSLTSNRPMPPIDLSFANGKESEEEVIADTPTFKLFRYSVDLSSTVDLRQYPFDTQELSIEIEDNRAGLDQIRIVPDAEHSHLGVNFEVPGWEVSYLEARVLNHYYPDRFDHDDLYYPRYKLNIGIRRFATSAAFTVFVPAFVIVLISLSGLWLPRDQFDARSNATAPMLAAAVFFHFALTQALPATAYLTRADKVMLAVYIVLLLNMLTTMLWFVFDDRHSETIFRRARLIVPPVSLAIMLIGSLA